MKPVVLFGHKSCHKSPAFYIRIHRYTITKAIYLLSAYFNFKGRNNSKGCKRIVYTSHLELLHECSAYSYEQPKITNGAGENAIEFVK